MSYGRGFPLPQYANGDMWVPVPPENGIRRNTSSLTEPMFVGQGFPHPRYANRDLWIPVLPDNGIGQNTSSLTEPMFAGQFPQGGGQILSEIPRRPILVDDGSVRGQASETWMRTPVKSNPMGHGIVGHRDSFTTIHQRSGISNGIGNGIVQNGEQWNQVKPQNPYSRGNGSGSSSSWTPVTPVKPIIEQVENENWGDLVGMYQDLLKEETLNLNKVAQDIYTPPIVQNNGNQVRVVSSQNKNLNLNPILNSTPVPQQNHNLNQGPQSVSYFPREEHANWGGSLLDAVVRPKQSSTSEAITNRGQNITVYDLNRTPVQNPATQVGGNSVRPAHAGSVLTNQQSLLMGAYSSNQIPSDGFLVPSRPCYDLNSPPRSELDAASSGITTGPLQFAPITPDTRRPNAENQWTPTKDGHENERNEGVDNHYNIRDSTSSAVSTTQKDHIVTEEGDELGIDLNKTPNQKTPARRKKHRPKVIREGKTKKTATPKEPKIPSNDTPVKRKYVRKSPRGNGVEVSPNGKRKYVRKKVVDQLDNQQNIQGEEGEEGAEPAVETPAKSCKKQLNFDLEEINLNDNPQDIEQERRINGILERSAMKVATNHNMYGGSIGTHDLNVPPTPMAKARDHTLNVLSRNMTMKISVAGQDMLQNAYNNQMGQHEPNGRMVNHDERRGVKRASFDQINHHNLNATDTLQIYQKMLLGNDNRADPLNDLASIMEIKKRMKTQKESQENNSSGDARQPNGANGNAPDSLLMCQKMLLGNDDRADRLTDLASIMEIRKRMKTQKEIQENNSSGDARQPNGTNGDASTLKLPDCPYFEVNGRRFVSPMAMPPDSQKQPANRSQKSTQGHGVNSVTTVVNWNRPPATPPNDSDKSIVPYPGSSVNNKRRAMQKSRQKSKGADKTMLQLPDDGSEVKQITFTRPKGTPRKQKAAATVDDITCMLDGLCIHDESEKARNALVPYKGNNAMIPFEPIKKRKPRPKVDLDPETDRLWRLLMGPEGSEANETLDKDKEKWWEDERRVFRGRADSFIARMHLVQGDRRFSRWKGSVVDSVIGVFLTQNVSDHLSSSAFMSLAAKFAFKSTSTNETRCQDGACVIVEEPIETVLPNNSLLSHGKLIRQPVFSKSDSEVILSQDSLDSSTIQTIDEIRSSSGSNSEPDDQTIGVETSNNPGPQKVSMFRELFSNSRENDLNLTMGRQNVGPDSFGLLREQSLSFFLELPQVHQYDFLSNNTAHINDNHQPPAKTIDGGQKQDLCSDNSKEQNYGSHDPLSGPDKKTLKGTKGNTEDEKKAFDWDSLRRDVYMKREKTERSKDAKDSLDYEALRSAPVSEISDAIRERGMNNLLADRIKDFLNRLVRDHGSIDLEWLRDAPPDKGKEYLLSIRGLGLKSVECVRLLTLHHLAFPVDTNVGRIAVRLGWVPLQPLPESLQLHLLEMYPVLETIQKYLWPRLCKLDQLTLYELHYQMITFGKVFCTKSKPNCNACPMRAECRHFASAFASARLALPGPEEKRMVPSDAPPNAAHTIPPVISRPMSLPPAENSSNKDARFTSQPIIEEPASPEPEPAELTLGDIEDQYYDDDDDDEIPTIKLDMNEFTINLQKMQESMEIQGDMSRALVALNPQAASIPTPKLKNVGRLRTEHLVYELPDSHPILEGLYLREPDDPSPYLLAIWTPGETANSMQPPENGCQAQETGILCDRSTCFSCNCVKEANSQVVRGTILMPCRTAMHGSFPLNGTYFQVNEMFADHASSLNPIEVPRAWIWNLTRRTVYFGTSVTTIFKGLTTQEIQQCFWRGFVCVRGFDQKMRSPRPLMARLHFPASKLVKTKNEEK